VGVSAPTYQLTRETFRCGAPVLAVPAGWVDRGRDGIVTVLALAVVVLLLYRDDVVEALAAELRRLVEAYRSPGEETRAHNLETLLGSWSVVRAVEASPFPS
jgi:hypothetical protein